MTMRLFSESGQLKTLLFKEWLLLQISAWFVYLSISCIGAGQHLISSTSSSSSLSLSSKWSAKDDKGNWVRLNKAPVRIITLSPHTTELIYSAGAGDKIVGTVEYSDYPKAALAIPRVGNVMRLDVERILALKPDLLVVWLNGGYLKELELFKKAGIPIFYSEPQNLNDVEKTIIDLGHLLGTDEFAKQSVQAIQMQRKKMAVQFKDLRNPKQSHTIKVFYQVWHQPLYTLNRTQLLSSVIEECGGENVFAHLPQAAPVVSVEDVIRANPDVIMTPLASEGSEKESDLDRWKKYKMMSAVKHQHLYRVHADSLSRPTARSVEGALEVCSLLDKVRMAMQSP